MRSVPELDLPGITKPAPTETPETLRRDFDARRVAQLERLLLKRKHDLMKVTVAGAFAGLLAVVITCGATRQGIFWHSFLMETVLCAVAGQLLVRRDGGVLTGTILFSAAYLLATLLRAMGLDPSVVFQPSDLAMAGSVQGNMTALMMLAGAGGVLGHMCHDG